MKKRNGGSGVGLGGMLTVLFIALKLAEVINWSWWWVLAPTWIPITVALLVLMLVGMVEAIKK